MLPWDSNNTSVAGAVHENQCSQNTTSTPNGVLLVNYIYVAIAWLIFTFGLFGNSLTVVVLRGRRLRQTSTVVYLTVLALVDILYLLCSLLINLINHTFVFPRDLRETSSLCRLAAYLNYTLAHLSVWLIVAVTVDRAIWVVWPFHAKTVCTQRNAMLNILGLITGFSTLDAHFFFTMTYTMHEGRLQCKPNYFTYKVFPYIDLVLISVLPFAFMITANACITWRLMRMRQFRRKRQKYPPVLQDRNSLLLVCSEAGQSGRIRKLSLAKYRAPLRSCHEAKSCLKLAPLTGTARLPNSAPSPDKSNSLTAMLVTVNVFFMVTVSPLLMYNIIYFVVNIEDWFDTNVNASIIVFAVEQLVYTLWYTNFAVHFVLYCLNGPPFRLEVKRLLNLMRPNSGQAEFRRTGKVLGNSQLPAVDKVDEEQWTMNHVEDPSVGTLE